MSTVKLLPKTVSVAVVGVGLVGSEFVRQLQALPLPNPFRLVSLSSSKATVFDPNGIPPTADWRALLRASSSSSSSSADLARTLAPLVRGDNAVVFVDNTAAVSVAETYPALLRAGVHVVTPNKKAFSGPQTLYDQIVTASRESGAKFLHEATVGAGLPVLSTLKDLVATGDKVNASFSFFGFGLVTVSCVSLWHLVRKGRTRIVRVLSISNITSSVVRTISFTARAIMPLSSTHRPSILFFSIVL
jgi:Homoserine dehydrogenase, NAD binding domain